MLQKWFGKSSTERANGKANRKELEPATKRSVLQLETLEDRTVPIVNLITQFEGLSQQASTPPDTTGAVGPTAVIEATNDEIAIYNKDGSLVQSVALGTFFQDVQQLGPFDPWIVYDRYSDRFFVLVVEQSDANTDANFLIAVSRANNPNDLDTAFNDQDDDWFFYRVNKTLDFGGGASWGDYPKIAVDADSVYITGNYFGFNGGGFQGVGITRLDKTSMLNGQQPTDTDILAPAGTGTLQPAQSVGRLATDPQLFADATPQGLRIWELNDANVLTPVTTFPANMNPSGPGNQLGGSVIDSLSNRLLNAVWRNNSLWTANTVDVNGEPTVQWYEVSTANNVYTLVQSGVIDPGVGVETIQPFVAVDSVGNMAITYTQTGPNQTPSMMVTSRFASDPLGTVQAPTTVRTSTDSYLGFRWGDYAAIGLDPVDDRTFYAMHEYVRGPFEWGTFLASFQVGTLQAIGGLDLQPTSQAAAIGTSVTLVATVVDVNGNPVAGAVVQFAVTGANSTTGAATTNANGQAVFSYTGFVSGTDTVTATVGQFVDAAVVNWLQEAVISGFVYVDSNNDGFFNPGELPIPGVTVQLTGTDNFGGTQNQFDVTDANGQWSFSGLLPGTYTVNEFQPNAYIDGIDTVGTCGGIVFDDAFVDIVVMEGDICTDYLFGERGLRPEFVSKRFFFSSTVSTALPGNITNPNFTGFLFDVDEEVRYPARIINVPAMPGVVIAPESPKRAAATGNVASSDLVQVRKTKDSTYEGSTVVVASASQDDFYSRSFGTDNTDDLSL